MMKERHTEKEYVFEYNKDMKVLADKKLLKIALENIIDNAHKYSSKSDDPKVTVKTAEDGTILITDNGVGVDIAYYNKLFGAFQRLHKEAEFKGTGIGLAIVNRIVQRHGGLIWAESELGQGTTFTLTLEINTKNRWD